MSTGPSTARLSPPSQRHSLCVARSIKGFTPPSDFWSWKISAPPIKRARPKKTAQRIRLAAEMTARVLDMEPFPLFVFGRFQEAVIQPGVAREQAQTGIEQERQQGGDSDRPAYHPQSNQRLDQHIPAGEQ